MALGEHGGAREGAGRKPAVAADAPPHDPETGEIKADIVSLENKPDRVRPTDYGNSAQAGLRRLEKAASAGDGNAADLLRRVVNPDDAMTVNGACVAMGWRKPTSRHSAHENGPVLRGTDPLCLLHQGLVRHEPKALPSPPRPTSPCHAQRNHACPAKPSPPCFATVSHTMTRFCTSRCWRRRAQRTCELPARYSRPRCRQPIYSNSLPTRSAISRSRTRAAAPGTRQPVTLSK